MSVNQEQTRSLSRESDSDSPESNADLLCSVVLIQC